MSRTDFSLLWLPILFWHAVNNFQATSGILSIKWDYQGCYPRSKDNINALAVSINDVNEKMLSPNECAKLCVLFGQKEAKRTRYFGLANGKECWCGESILLNSLMDSSQCMSLCPGNWQFTCGGSSAMDVYSIGVDARPKIPAPAIGCYLYDNRWHPVLSDRVLVTSSARMSHHHCAAPCLDMRMGLAGLANGTACYCGSGLVRSAVKATAGVCGKPCKGNKFEFCGGNEYMLVLKAVQNITV